MSSSLAAHLKALVMTGISLLMYWRECPASISVCRIALNALGPKSAAGVRP